MHISNIAFYAMLFFLIGVGAYSYIKSTYLLVAIILISGISLLAYFYYFNGGKGANRIFLALLFLLVGILYNFGYLNYINESNEVPFNEKTSFQAIVIDDPSQRQGSQMAVLKLTDSYRGKILLSTVKYPSLKYGDVVQIIGTIKEPYPVGYADYLSKEKIYGVIYYPDLEIIDSNKGSNIKSFLYGIKNSFESNINRVLPAQEAAFMNGILLGERAEFSDEFKENMRLSGTTHLVALSGYNITIIAWSVVAFLAVLGIAKRYAFWISVVVIIGFVVMTGAQASVVRAAIMGVILLFAEYSGRIASTRNAILAAAFAMVVVNPSILRYDIGFQLSFLALLGIVYLMPAIKNKFGFQLQNSLLGWKEHALTTFSAQIMVIPLILNSFGSFSPISFLTNILILEVIPISMFLGFVTGIAGYISIKLSILLGWISYVPLIYETWLINSFAKISFPIAVESVSVVLMVVYYFLIALFINKNFIKNHKTNKYD